MTGALRTSGGVLLLFHALTSPAAPQGADLAAQAARARSAMEAQRYDEAATLYADLVDAVPDNPGLRLNLGIALHSAGRFDRAAAELDRVVRQDPSMTPGWLMLGLTHLKLRRPDRAIAPLERVVSKEPGHPLARLELADAYLQVRRFEDAARHFEALTTVDPKSPKAWLGLGRSYASIARTAFERLEQDAPGSAYWAALLARARAAQQQYRSAFHLYRQALAAHPGLRGAHAALAEIYRRTDRPDWAAEEDRREQALPPPDCGHQPLECELLAGRHTRVLERTAQDAAPASLYWRALAASDLALSAFGQLESLPPSLEIHQLRAEGYAIRGLHDLEIKEWEAARALAPEDARVQRGLALAHWRNQDYAVARPLLDALVRRDIDHAGLQHALGDTLLQLQMPEAAIPHLLAAVERDAGLTAARVALARAHARAGSWEAAVPHLEATLPSDEDGSLHLLLARAYAAAGREAESTRLMRQSQELGEAARSRRAQANDDAAITPP